MKRTHIALLVLAILFLIWLQPIDFGTAEITIQKGANAREIAEYLSARGVVRDKNEFLFWLKISGKGKHLRSGNYELRRYSNPLFLINELTLGGTSDVVVTIPEGITLHETATMLANHELVTQEHFVALCNDRNFIAEFGLPGSSLEGYLFPDTYSFSSTQSDSSIVKTFVENFKNHIMKYGITNRDSVYMIVTLASLVEKEAKYEDERPIIAQVFINRLTTRRPLESCATILYVLKNRNIHKTNLTENDLKIDSPYNTYLHIGLPPGPICSPGESSIKAVVAPADVDYLYFVSKGDGRHYFSRTYQEHCAAKERYNATK